MHEGQEPVYQQVSRQEGTSQENRRPLGPGDARRSGAGKSEETEGKEEEKDGFEIREFVNPLRAELVYTFRNMQQPKNPLHGITLEMILTQLVEHYGWEEMGRTINIRCFNNAPSIKSSLQFLRKNPWARSKVETLYLKYKRKTLK